LIVANNKIFRFSFLGIFHLFNLIQLDSFLHYLHVCLGVGSAKITEYYFR
jgi:hypothetical protein